MTGIFVENGILFTNVTTSIYSHLFDQKLPRLKILSEYSHRSVILLHKVVEKGLRVFAAIDLDYEARITGANNASQERYDYRSSVIEFAYFT